MARQPVMYVPHGGGPWPWMSEGPFGGDAVWGTLRSYLRSVGREVREPRAILCVTAHWEAPVPTVSSHPAPPMLFDYYGFPEHTYAVSYPAPGAPWLAARVRELLGAAGVPSAEDRERGLDHGTFVPLAVAWPRAEVPVVQLSLVQGLVPDTHLQVGRALAPLRDEGVLILGSGMSYHDLRGLRSQSGARSAEAFDAWLRDVVQREEPSRNLALALWEEAPEARACHPREEHLLPLMVVAGAAGPDRGEVPFSDMILGARVSAVRFGGGVP